MQDAPIPEDEACRIATLRNLGVLDSQAEERFDRVTRLVRRLLQVPTALVSLVDEDRQWFKSRQGLDATETPRAISFCGHAVAAGRTLHVPDARLDERFHDNPLVTGAPHVCFYLGVPLRAPNGAYLGTLCAIDTRPREIDDVDVASMSDLAAIVEDELLSLDLATRDALTGLANRSSLNGVAHTRIEKLASGDSESEVSLLVFDLDRFKAINDELGHVAGDTALRQFSSALRGAFRESDIVARVGGDEFCVLFDGALERSEAPLQRLARFVAVLNEARPLGFPIAYSAGGAGFDPTRHAGLKELFEAADTRMYRAKRERQGALHRPRTPRR